MLLHLHDAIGELASGIRIEGDCCLGEKHIVISLPSYMDLDP